MPTVPVLGATTYTLVAQQLADVGITVEYDGRACDNFIADLLAPKYPGVVHGAGAEPRLAAHSVHDRADRRLQPVQVPGPAGRRVHPGRSSSATRPRRPRSRRSSTPTSSSRPGSHPSTGCRAASRPTPTRQSRCSRRTRIPRSTTSSRSPDAVVALRPARRAVGVGRSPALTPRISSHPQEWSHAQIHPAPPAVRRGSDLRDLGHRLRPALPRRRQHRPPHPRPERHAETRRPEGRRTGPRPSAARAVLGLAHLRRPPATSAARGSPASSSPSSFTEPPRRDPLARASARPSSPRSCPSSSASSPPAAVDGSTTVGPVHLVIGFAIPGFLIALVLVHDLRDQPATGSKRPGTSRSRHPSPAGSPR